MLPNVVQLSPPIYVPKGCPSKISPTAETCVYHSEVEESAGLLGQDRVSIDVLPDELLLGIFYFLCVDDDYEKGCEPTWEMLVHVCRRWRYIVFAAPHRLGLRLLCTGRTLVVRKLDVWPALPIVIRAADYGGFEDNTIAALKHNDRISEIYILWLSRSGSYHQLRKRKVMQDPYPALTDLHILSHVAASPALPDSFLGGSAPRLRSLHLRGVDFPALPKLLLSSSAGLVSLSLWEIPPRKDFSAEAMVDCLSSLTNLEKLWFDFTCCRSNPIRRQYSPHARTALPVLYSLSLKGLIEHLQDFYARIETPLLKDSHLEFLDPDIFDISTISPFVRHKEPLRALDQAYIVLNGFNLNIRLSSRNPSTGGRSLMLSFMHNDTLRWRWRLRSLTQDHRPFSPWSTSPLAEFDRLNDLPFKDQNSPHWLRTMIGNARLRELLRVSPSVKDLYLSEGLAVLVVPALQELAAREGVLVATQVLPALQTLFVERHWFSRTPREKAFEFEEFVAAREVSGHPVSLQCWV